MDDLESPWGGMLTMMMIFFCSSGESAGQVTGLIKFLLTAGAVAFHHHSCETRIRVLKRVCQPLYVLIYIYIYIMLDGVKKNSLCSDHCRAESLAVLGRCINRSLHSDSSGAWIAHGSCTAEHQSLSAIRRQRSIARRALIAHGTQTTAEHQSLTTNRI